MLFTGKIQYPERIIEIMNKTTALFSALLLFLILVLNPLLLNVRVANASTDNVAVEWGHLETIGHDSPVDPDEYNRESSVCGLIDWYYAIAGWSHLYAYWTATTPYNVPYALNWIQDPDNCVNFATTWWVGDFKTASTNPLHYGFNARGSPPNYYDDTISDTSIYTSTINYGSSKQYFDFIWTCVNAGVYWSDYSGGQNQVCGITYPDTVAPTPVPSSSPPVPTPSYFPSNTNTYYGYTDYQTGPGGMAFAWTNTINMCPKRVWRA
jgi:hypothetical protein